MIKLSVVNVSESTIIINDSKDTYYIYLRPEMGRFFIYDSVSLIFVSKQYNTDIKSIRRYKKFIARCITKGCVEYNNANNYINTLTTDDFIGIESLNDTITDIIKNDKDLRSHLNNQ